MDAIENRIKAIHDNLNHWMTPEILKSCLGMTDLTSLKSTDTCASIRKLTEKVNDFQKRFPDYPLPASICVYPNFAKTVRQTWGFRARARNFSPPSENIQKHPS